MFNQPYIENGYAYVSFAVSGHKLYTNAVVKMLIYASKSNRKQSHKIYTGKGKDKNVQWIVAAPLQHTVIPLGLLLCLQIVLTPKAS